MTWRIGKCLIEGELDNTAPGRVRGWLKVAGMAERVELDLSGDFREGIRGRRLRLSGEGAKMHPKIARLRMEGFEQRQTGTAGDITDRLGPGEGEDMPYIEWYSDANDRVVIDVEVRQLQVLDAAPARQADTLPQPL